MAGNATGDPQYPRVFLCGKIMPFASCPFDREGINVRPERVPCALGPIAHGPVSLRFDLATATLHVDPTKEHGADPCTDAAFSSGEAPPFLGGASDGCNQHSSQARLPMPSQTFSVILGHPCTTCPAALVARRGSGPRTPQGNDGGDGCGDGNGCKSESHFGGDASIDRGMKKPCDGDARGAETESESLLPLPTPASTLAAAGTKGFVDPRASSLSAAVAVRVATCVLVECRGRVLVTRRPRTMRTFPLRWVLPGGHAERGEELSASAARELEEETGLVVAASSLTPFAAWESVYPPRIEEGDPRRQHIIVFFRAVLDGESGAGAPGVESPSMESPSMESPSMESSSMDGILNGAADCDGILTAESQRSGARECPLPPLSLQEDEVDAAAWLSRRQVKIALGRSATPSGDGEDLVAFEAFLPGTGEGAEPLRSRMSFSELDGSAEGGLPRLSHAAFFVLGEWLDLCVEIP